MTTGSKPHKQFHSRRIKFLSIFLLSLAAVLNAAQAAPVIEEFEFASSFDGTAPLFGRATFDPERKNLPLMVLQHGYHGDRAKCDFAARRIAELGYFCVAFDTRGWAKAGGKHDDGGIEILDIYDGIQAVKKKFGDRIDAGRISIIGYSNGGANVYFSAVRFPYLFRGALALFGIPNYQQWATLRPAWEKYVFPAVGGSPKDVPDKYLVRNAALGAGNLKATRFHIAHDEEETICPPIMAEEFFAAAQKQGVSNIFLHVSKKGDASRWRHGYSIKENPLSGIEDIFLADIEKASAPTMPAEGSLTVLGFLITPRFACILGNGDDAVANVDFTCTATGASFQIEPIEPMKSMKGILTLGPEVLEGDLPVKINGHDAGVLKGGERTVTFTAPVNIEIGSVPH